MKCLRCGYQATGNPLYSSCPLCGFTEVTGSSTTEKINPWETSAAGSAPLKSLSITLYNSFFKTRRFFSSLTGTPSIIPAFIYGLLTGSIGVLAALLWNNFPPLSFLSIIAGSGYTGDYRSTASPLSIAATPILLVTQLVLVAFFVHAMLYITKSKKGNFSATFKTVCYAEGAALLHLIPLVGTALSFMGWLYLIVAGIHASHGISVTRVCAVLLSPLLLFAACAAAGFIMLVIALALLSGSYLHLFQFFGHQ
jgi:hypothetical protein